MALPANHASSGNVHLAWNPTNSTQRGISFNRGTPSAPMAFAKLTSTFGIVASPSPCQAAVGQTTCQVEIDWEAVGAVLGRAHGYSGAPLSGGQREWKR